MSAFPPLPRHAPIVVKIGTSSLLGPAGGVDPAIAKPLAKDIAAAMEAGHPAILVSSGAIGMGRRRMEDQRRPAALSLPRRQALAAVGQVELMRAWTDIFGRLGLTVAQVLLTREDLSSRRRYLNARHTLRALLEAGVLPIVNENDTVSTEEIQFGDNDALAAMVAGVVDAALLVNLTGADGLWTADPARDPGAHPIPVVSRIDARLEAMAGGPGSNLGTGGMASKLQAARIATGAGAAMVIASASASRAITKAIAGETVGTRFTPHPRRLGGRARWIAFGGKPHGVIVVDEGAANAVRRHGRSLLPVGVRMVRGRFDPGDLVMVETETGEVVGQGLTNYGAADLTAIAGCPSHRIHSILGAKPYDEAIHRNNLVVDSP